MSLLKAKSTASNKIHKMKQDLANPKNMTPLNLIIDSALHKAFKIKTISNGVSMTDVIVEAMEAYIK